jgi:hypothetical protein
MQRILLLAFLAILTSSCIKETTPVITDLTDSYLAGKGVFVVNEGNFRSGNGSLSFFSYDSLKIYNHVFLDINNRPLGDIPYSMNIHGSNAYIIVNNSDKIEVVNSNDMKSVAVINRIKSPRYISFITDAKAYVTSLYSDSITVINLLTNSVSGYIDIKTTSESIATLYSDAFVASWINGNKIMVINTLIDKVTDSISVGREPESMVIDKNETLWVLCNGGWNRDYYAELLGINTRTKGVEKRFTFPLKTDSPVCLQINKRGETLFYIHNGVRMMNIEAETLPSDVFIPGLDHNFYKMGVNPENGEIFVTDAGDFTRKGQLIRYSIAGTIISSYQTDIIPGSICFKVDPDSDFQ